MKRAIMRRSPALLLAVLVTLFAGIGAVRAEPAEADYRRLNESLVERHVVPGYARLAEATAGLRTSADAFCATPSAPGLETLRDAYGAAADAWQGIQHVRFGPVELFMRSVRFAFWPDPRNTVGRQLTSTLASRDPEAVAQSAFDKGSIAVQGLPALERLLYGKDSAEALLASGDDARYRCTMVVAVSHNLAVIAADVETAWTDGPGAFAAVISRAGPDNDRYRDPKEATLDLFKSLYTAVELVADHKLAKPLGASLAAARPNLAESWRSERSLHNVRANLAAAEAMYRGAGGYGMSDFVRKAAGDAALDDLLTRAFAQTRATAEQIALPLESAVSDPAARPAVEQLATEAAALKQLLVQRLSTALGIPVGFNALDGD